LKEIWVTVIDKFESVWHTPPTLVLETMKELSV
jgi:hypothetical protein